MHVRILLAAVAVSALAIPGVQAQTTAAPDDRVRVEVPRPGRVSSVGLRLSDVSTEHMKTLKLSKQEGAVVESVRANSPAASAGFLEKDVIVQFDGERVRSASHLTRLVGETPAGREVIATVIRDGRRVDLRVTPEAGDGWFDPRFGGMIDLDADQWREQMEQAGRAARELGRNLPEMIAPNRGRLGVTVQEVSGDLAAYFGVKAGVLVSRVAPDSAAAKAGLRAGDVITAVNGTAVATPRELVAAFPAGDAAHDVTLTVFRDRKAMTVKATLAAPTPTTSRRSRGERI